MQIVAIIYIIKIKWRAKTFYLKLSIHKQNVGVCVCVCVRAEKERERQRIWIALGGVMKYKNITKINVTSRYSQLFYFQSYNLLQNGYYILIDQKMENLEAECWLKVICL